MNFPIPEDPNLKNELKAHCVGSILAFNEQLEELNISFVNKSHQLDLKGFITGETGIMGLILVYGAIEMEIIRRRCCTCPHCVQFVAAFEEFAKLRESLLDLNEEEPEFHGDFLAMERKKNFTGNEEQVDEKLAEMEKVKEEAVGYIQKLEMGPPKDKLLALIKNYTFGGIGWDNFAREYLAWKEEYIINKFEEKK